MRRFALLAVTLLAVVWTARFSLAQGLEEQPVTAPLAERIPRDALFYLGWAGSSNVKQSYAGTHAEALVAASDLQVLLERTLPGIGEAISRQNDEARPWVKFATEISPILFRHPTAVAFGGVDFSNPDEPLPRVMIICDAGSEAAQLRSKFAELFTMLGNVGLVTLMDVKDGMVYLSVGWQKLDLAVLETNAAGSLSRDERFTDAMRDMVSRPASVLFVDLPGLTRWAEEQARRDNGEEGAQNLTKFLDATGLRNLGSIAATTGFAGKQYVTHAFVEARGARTGLLSLLDGEPLDESLLAAVPADAGFVAAGRFDAAKLLEAARNAIVVTQPNQVGDFEQGLKFLNMLVGVDIENDLLKSLGTSWAAYTSPLTTDTALGMVAINKPAEPQRVESALKNLSLSLVSLINQNTRQKGQPFRLSSREAQTPQGLVNYLDLPVIAPAWSTSEELVYFGLYPQTVASARAIEPDASFASSEAYAAVKALAGERPIHTFSYVDLPRYSARSYMGATTILQFGGGMLSGYGEANNIAARFPPMVLPPYATFRQHVTPAISVTWVDERGLHLRSSEAFPGSGLLGIGMQ